MANYLNPTRFSPRRRKLHLSLFLIWFHSLPFLRMPTTSTAAAATFMKSNLGAATFTSYSGAKRSKPQPLCFQALQRIQHTSISSSTTKNRTNNGLPDTLRSSLGYSTDEDFTYVLDTETRRQQRLERLHRHTHNNLAPLPIPMPIPMEIPKQISPISERMERKNLEDLQMHVPDNEEEARTKSPQQKNFLGERYLSNVDQNNSILSEAPAILMEGAAGTGKTTVLAGRVAHLLRERLTEPQNMIVLSFTNRDAIALKDKALQLLFGDDNEGEYNDEKNINDEKIDRDDVEKKLWCGTIHSFAINILRKYNNNHNDAPLRIISSKEVGNRIRNCLGRINASQKDRMSLYKAALEETNQSIGRLVNYIMRCLELWKEAGVLATPYAYTIKFAEEEGLNSEHPLTQDDYVELAMRLGIPQNAAILALDIAEDYQTMHASMGTADPSDVALMAYDFLMSNPKALHALRTKLHQVILDEYQDVSVSQHKLLRLIILGADEDENRRHDGQQAQHYPAQEPSKATIPVLVSKTASRKSRRNNNPVCYHVPKIICAGDANQSIYGWRGAAPSLTVDGFQRDFPQGLVVPLQTSFRLPRPVLNAANVLLDDGDKDDTENIDTYSPVAYEISPAAAVSASTVASKHKIFNQLEDTTVKLGKDEIHPSLSIGQRLLVEDGLMSESRSSVFIQGLWDTREEAKYIASEIRKRSKERMRSFSKALKKLTNTATDNEGSASDDGYAAPINDSTDVAIMVRSKNMLKMHEQALQNCGIPYVIPKGENGASSSTRSNPVNIFRGRQSKLLPMKPVKLITMHKAKGDEFDDVYLSGWTEGVFPHPSSLKSNRQHEERRIAYVALTRARQRVVITYSCIKRVPYFGSSGERRYVTEQVEPSRFLFDLMDGSNKDGAGPTTRGQGQKQQAFVEWSQSGGFKEWVAGKNIPHEFAKSYRAPVGFTRSPETSSHTRHLPTSSPPLDKNVSNIKRVNNDVVYVTSSLDETAMIPNTTRSKTSKVSHQEKEELPTPQNITNTDTDTDPDRTTAITNEDVDDAVAQLLVEIKSGLHQIFNRERGACKKFHKIFRAVLKDFGIHRGSAIILTEEGREREELSQAVDALARAPVEVLTTRPLSRCTAEQLGLYLIYLLHLEMQ